MRLPARWMIKARTTPASAISAVETRIPQATRSAVGSDSRGIDPNHRRTAPEAKGCTPPQREGGGIRIDSLVSPCYVLAHVKLRIVPILGSKAVWVASVAGVLLALFAGACCSG